MANKITVVEKYESIIEKIENGVMPNAEDIAFLNERKDQHAKKNASRKAKGETPEMTAFKEQALSVMESGKQYTATNIMTALSLTSTSKATAILKKLMSDGAVERAEVKGVAYFSKV